MALETGTYIDDLVSSNPPQSDSLSQAAGHLRLIKALLLATFPNITGAMTGTHTELNTAAALATSGQYVPAGVMFEYGGASLPTGYLWCDGASYLRADYPGLFTAIGTTHGAADGTHFNVPDCKDRMSICKGTTFSTLGAKAGASSVTLAQANIPSYNLSASIAVTGTCSVSVSGSTSTVVRSLNLDNNTGGGNSGRATIISQDSGAASFSGSGSGSISGTAAGNISSGGSGTSFSILNPYIVVNKIIKT